MLYLSKKYKKFIPFEYYWETMEWFFYQIAQVGPYLGQAHQFLHYHSGKSIFAEEKYKNYVKRVYETLDQRLIDNEYLGVEYSIADIATWPWIARFEIHKAELNQFSHILRWYKNISERPAVIKGFNVVGDFVKIPMP